MTAQSQVTEHLVLVVGVGVTASVVSVHAQVVTQAVREKGSAGSGIENLLGIALENAEGQQSINGNLVGVEVEVIPEHATLDELGGFLLHAEDNVVNVSRLLGKLASQGKGSGLSRC